MESQTFDQLALDSRIQTAVARQGYTTPTPIQAQSIPILMNGHDLLGTAQTGTGKTAAFVLPLLHRLLESGPLNERQVSNGPARQAPTSSNGRRNSRGQNRRGDSRRPQAAPAQPALPRALILAPTRELAIQIGDSLAKYGSGSGLRHTVIYGGAPKPGQAAKLQSNPDILAATPGRLMDFIQEGRINLETVQFLILDEADRMLDMGFVPEVRKIAGMMPVREQTVLFSATMPREIERLAQELLKNPQRVAIAPAEVTVDRIKQTVLHMNRDNKATLLPKLIQDRSMFRVIVFTRTKHRAARLAKQLSKMDIPSDSIHGDRTQGQRQRALDSFRRGKIQALVATDVAARGLDVDDITHVINYEIPNEPESYIHRIGRTARAGTDGAAIAMCDREELKDLRNIERLLGSPIEVDRDHEFHLEPPAARSAGGRNGSRAGSGRSGGSRSGGSRGGNRRSNSWHGNDSSRQSGNGGNYPHAARDSSRPSSSRAGL